MKNEILKKLKATTIPISELSEVDKNRLFNLYEHYYESISKKQFIEDLEDKNKIIILKNSNEKICGFSTLSFFKLEDHPDRPYCIYSGDTIIHQDYWGTSALTMEFLKNILIEKIKHPFSNVWWFLISKGYKTYLLLANNFHEFYPRAGVKIPHDKLDVIDFLSQKVYPNRFDRETGIISFKGSDHEKLKMYVAPISEQMCKNNENINFFQKSNPNWQEGDELACIGKVSFLLGIIHPFKVLKKVIKKKYWPKMFKSSKTKI